MAKPKFHQEREEAGGGEGKKNILLTLLLKTGGQLLLNGDLNESCFFFQFPFFGGKNKSLSLSLFELIKGA